MAKQYTTRTLQYLFDGWMSGGGCYTTLVKGKKLKYGVLVLHGIGAKAVVIREKQGKKRNWGYSVRRYQRMPLCIEKELRALKNAHSK